MVNDDGRESATRGRAEAPAGVDSPRLQVVGDDAYPDWDAIYVDNVSRIYRLMYTKVGNRPDAEDLAAEVFVSALGPLRVSASRGEVRSYLLVTSANRAGRVLAPSSRGRGHHHRPGGRARPAWTSHLRPVKCRSGRSAFWARSLSVTGRSSTCDF